MSRTLSCALRMAISSFGLVLRWEAVLVSTGMLLPCCDKRCLMDCMRPGMQLSFDRRRRVIVHAAFAATYSTLTNDLFLLFFWALPG